MSTITDRKKVKRANFFKALLGIFVMEMDFVELLCIQDHLKHPLKKLNIFSEKYKIIFGTHPATESGFFSKNDEFLGK